MIAARVAHPKRRCCWNWNHVLRLIGGYLVRRKARREGATWDTGAGLGIIRTRCNSIMIRWKSLCCGRGRILRQHVGSKSNRARMRREDQACTRCGSCKAHWQHWQEGLFLPHDAGVSSSTTIVIATKGLTEKDTGESIPQGRAEMGTLSFAICPGTSCGDFYWQSPHTCNTYRGYLEITNYWHSCPMLQVWTKNLQMVWLVERALQSSHDFFG
jgi:hypothetical protein